MARSMIRISIAEAGKSPQLLTYNKPAITLGRAAQHDLCLTGKGVSSTHCRILREGDAYVIEDLGSTNGTYVNRQRVQGRLRIGPQDDVVLAVYRLRVLADGESGVSARPHPGSGAMPAAMGSGESPMMGTPGMRHAAPTDYVPAPSGAMHPSMPSSMPSSMPPSMPPSGPSMPPSGPVRPPSGLGFGASGPSMPPSATPSGVAVPPGSGAVPVVGSSRSVPNASGPSPADMAWGREWEQIDKLSHAWLSSGKDGSQLLRGDKLAHARKWLAQGRGKQPPPKPLHRDFILAGARARALRGLGGVLTGALVLGGLGVGGWMLLQQKEQPTDPGDEVAATKLDLGGGTTPPEDRGDAEAAAALADLALGEPDPVLATLLAAEAVVRLPRDAAEPDAVPFAVLRSMLRDLPGRPLRGHRGQVERVALSPDGRWAITAGSRGDDVRLWDLDQPGVLEPSSLNGHPRGLTGMEVSQDGRWLVTADADGLAMRWSLQDRDPAASNVRLEDHRAPISALDLSANGRWLVTGDETGVVKVWDLEVTPLPVATTLLRGHEAKVTAVSINDDGTRVVSSGEDMTARNWRLTEGRGKNPVVVLHEEVVVTAVAVAPDDRWAVSGGSDAVVRLWSPTTRAPTRNWSLLVGHKGPVSRVEVTADSSMAVSVAGDSDLWIWDLQAKVPSASSVRLSGHAARIHQLALYSPPPGTAAARRVPTSAFTVSEDGTARSWDLDKRKEGAPSRVFAGHDGGVRSVAVSGDGQWAITGGADKVARVWDWQSLPFADAGGDEGMPRVGSASKVGRGHTGGVVAVAVDPFGRRMITGSADGTARVWDLHQPTRIEELPLKDVHTDRVRAVAVSTANEWAASGDNAGRLVLWDIQQDSPPAQALMGHSGEIGAVAFTPDGKRLISVSTDRTARVWTMGTDPESDVVVLPHDDEVTQLAVSGEGRWLLTGTLTGAVLWDLKGSLDAPAQKLGGHEDDLRAVALGARGRWAATGSQDQKILLHDLNKGKLVAKLRAHEGAVQVMAFHPAAKWLASGSEDRTIRLWDLTSEHPDEGSLQLTGHTGGITDLRWSEDGRWLVSSSNDQTVRLWDTRKPYVQMLEDSIVLDGHTNVVPRVALVSSERRLTHVISVSYDGTARLWPLVPDELVKLACSAAGRRLTQEEWDANVGGKYRPAC